MIARSASRSTSDTKSLIAFCVTDKMSRFCAARLMFLPARRAAFTAVLSIGCMVRKPYPCCELPVHLPFFFACATLYVNCADALKNIRVVLTQTSHPGNIGAAARALKTMGLGTLALVRPRQVAHPDAAARAAGALDVLQRAQVHESLAAAPKGCTLAVAGESRPGGGAPRAR